MKLSALVPPITDRAFIAGQTGSGKTVLAHYLLMYREWVVVCDPKRRIEWDGYRTCNTLKALTKAKDRRLIYRPNHEAIKDWDNGNDEIQAFFEWIYRRGNTTLYVDESYLVTRGEQIPTFYHACLTQGRELGIETWSATQRPMNLPQVLMSEAEHNYVFRLRLPQDRKKVQDMCGVSQARIEALDKRQFLFAPQSGDVAGPFTLSL